MIGLFSFANFMLAATTTYQATCSYAYLNQAGWININMLVVLAFMLIASLIYAISSLLPASKSERVKGLVKFELVQGVISVLLIVAILSFADVTCNAGAALMGPYSGYQDPFQYSHFYLGTLVFTTGVSLISNLWSQGIILLVDGNLVGDFLSSIPLGHFSGGPFSVEFGIGDEATYVFFEYNGILTQVFSVIVVLTSGILVIVFLILPAVEQLALGVVLPVAIIMRSLSFTGPRLREAANSFIALALAFYFVFPMTIVMDSYITGWLYCTNGTICNPYSGYLGSYPLSNLPVSPLFKQTGEKTLGIDAPLSIYSAEVSGNGGIGSMLTQMLEGLVRLPALVQNFIPSVAEYVFQGIILLGLDLAITVGFAIGLTKSFAAASSFMHVGPVL